LQGAAGIPYLLLPSGWLSTFSLLVYESPNYIVRTYNTSGEGGVETVPAGVTTATIEVYGGGGGGALEYEDAGYGGGGGAYSKISISVTPGDTINYNVAIGGSGGYEAGGNYDATNGTNSYAGGNVSGGTFYIEAGGGTGGISSSFPGVAGIGGIASGGTTNINGSNSGPLLYFNASDGGPASGPLGGAGGVANNDGDVPNPTTNGSIYGGGGGGASGVAFGGNGAGGLVVFTYGYPPSNPTYLLDKDQNFILESFPDVSYQALPLYYAQEVPITGAQQSYGPQRFFLGPTPDRDYTFLMEYAAYAASVIDATNTWLSDNFETVLLYGAVREAYLYLKGEADLIQQYESRYQEGLAMLKMLADGKNRQDAYRNGQVRIKVT
jgi:hypothetical protein